MLQYTLSLLFVYSEKKITNNMEYNKAFCKNCYRKLGERREIIQSPSTKEWVHQNMMYDTKCDPFLEYVAEPMDE